MQTFRKRHPRPGRIGSLRALVVVLAVALGAPAAGTKPAAAATDWGKALVDSTLS